MDENHNPGRRASDRAGAGPDTVSAKEDIAALAERTESIREDVRLSRENFDQIKTSLADTVAAWRGTASDVRRIETQLQAFLTDFYAWRKANDAEHAVTAQWMTAKDTAVKTLYSIATAAGGLVLPLLIWGASHVYNGDLARVELEFRVKQLEARVKP
jgi:hypothetical protein